MSVASEHVSVFRDEWADRLVDTCDIKRLAGRGAINATTLQYDAESITDVYLSRPCLIRPLTPGAPVTTDFGQQEVTVTDYVFFFAYDTVGLEVEDRLIPQTVHADGDTELVGQVFRISSIEFDSYKTRMMVTASLDLGPGETS